MSNTSYKAGSWISCVCRLWQSDSLLVKWNALGGLDHYRAAFASLSFFLCSHLLASKHTEWTVSLDRNTLSLTAVKDFGFFLIMKWILHFNMLILISLHTSDTSSFLLSANKPAVISIKVIRMFPGGFLPHPPDTKGCAHTHTWQNMLWHNNTVAKKWLTKTTQVLLWQQTQYSGNFTNIIQWRWSTSFTSTLCQNWKPLKLFWFVYSL